MGHSTPARQAVAAQITQERYTHTLPGELEQALKLFETYIDAEAKRKATG